MSQRFAVMLDGRSDTQRLSLDQAAERIADGRRSGARRIEARAAAGGRALRPLSHAETKALAWAAALALQGDSAQDRCRSRRSSL